MNQVLLSVLYVIVRHIVKAIVQSSKSISAGRYHSASAQIEWIHSFLSHNGTTV
jgi:hypothetical protein